MVMTAKDIIRRICADLFQTSFVMPNYTPANWFECDVFEITGAGYFREYEVKVTRADFARDREKGGASWRWDRSAGKVVREKLATKHELLAARAVRGPVEFNFVVPEGLVAPGEVPDWAGLIQVKRGGGVLWTACRKDAPRIHNVKADTRLRVHASSTCYWRMHRLIQRCGELAT